MIPFYGIDLTTNRKNQQPSGQVFLAKRTSSALTQSLTASADKAEEKLCRAKLPLLLRMAQYLCGIVALVFALGILRANVTFAEGYQCRLDLLDGRPLPDTLAGFDRMEYAKIPIRIGRRGKPAGLLRPGTAERCHFRRSQSTGRCQGCGHFVLLLQNG